METYLGLNVLEILLAAVLEEVVAFRASSAAEKSLDAASSFLDVDEVVSFQELVAFQKEEEQEGAAAFEEPVRSWGEKREAGTRCAVC